MKILLFTSGAAQMYCGSCLRDNALASALKAAGHDIILLPLYTPTRTDEANASFERVFFGGISVYLEQASPLFRHTPRFLDRLWDSKLALALASKSSIPTSPKLLGELAVSVLRGESGFQKKEIAKLVDWLRHEPPPDVINLPYALLISLAKPLKEALRRPVCLTLQGEDLFLEGLHEPYRSQALDLIVENLPYVDAFLPVSHYYADFMAGYLGIPRAKMHVVPLGINPEAFAHAASRTDDRWTVGFLARIAPEKGLHNLAGVYLSLREKGALQGSTLAAAGYLPPEHRSYLDGIEAQFSRAGLAGEFAYAGELSRQDKVRFLSELDVFSVPTDYVEPKGMFLLEAMAAGVPVVQPAHGAFPELIEKTGGGLTFHPGDEEAFRQVLLRLYKDRNLGSRLGNQGASGVREHFTADRMATRAIQVYSGMIGR